jgi:NTE family protein
VDWIAASSIGAVNAAVIAGNPGELRLARLRELWTVPEFAAPAGVGAWRHAYNWMRAVQTRLLGAPGHFHPRYMTAGLMSPVSLYDLAPLRERLKTLVDFDRLNSGEMRVAVAATDITTGDTVVFDTSKGTRIGMDHLMASAGYLPEFAPVEIGGRLLGDGGLSANAPAEAVLLEKDAHPDERICIVVDLFARDGERPRGLEAALERKNDLLLSNQTYKRLELMKRQIDLECELALERDRSRAVSDAASGDVRAHRNRTRAILYLSYRAPREEAGPEKPFDLSLATVNDRWRAGDLDMTEALHRLRLEPLPPRGCALMSIRRRREVSASALERVPENIAPGE